MDGFVTKLGHNELDIQHADLHHCIRQLQALTHRQFSALRVAALLAQMETMLSKHFATEEAVMDQLTELEPLLRAAHVEEHRRILAEVAALRLAHNVDTPDSLARLCATAGQWVFAHVRDFDELLIPHLRGTLLAA